MYFITYNLYYFDDYVTCLDLSDDGKRILASTVSIKDGAYVSNFKIYRRGEDQAFVTYDVYDEISLECGQLASDEYYLITERGVRIFDIKGNIVKEYFISDDDNFIDFYKSGFLFTTTRVIIQYFSAQSPQA